MAKTAEEKQSSVEQPIVPKVKAKAKSKSLLKVSVPKSNSKDEEETQQNNLPQISDAESTDENDLLIQKGYEEVKQKLVEINTEINKNVTDRMDVLEDKTKNLNKMYDDMKANCTSNKNLNINDVLNEIVNGISDIKTEIKGSVHDRILNLENKRDEMTNLIDKLLQLYNKLSLNETSTVAASSSSVKAKTHIDYDSEVED